MRIRFSGKRTPTLLIAVIIAAGVLCYAMADLPAGTFVERFQLATTIRPVSEVRLQLSIAEKRLDRMTGAEDVATSTVSQLVGEYTQAIRSALKVTDGIKDTKEKKAALLETFHRLAYHQPLLRAVVRRPSHSSLSLVDKARYENMAVQEQSVKRISQMPSDVGPLPATSSTERTLACPECNVIIVSLTTLRKDHIGLYGYEKPTTPNIDSFFKNSLRFTNSLAPSAWTIPDAVSLFTSLFPYTHGIAVREPPSVPLLYNKKVITLAQILSEDGYRTAAFTGGGDYNSRLSGLDRGFDFYLDEVNYPDFNIAADNSLGAASLYYAPLRSFVGLSAQWLSENADKKFFLFVQGYDTHCPYVPHEPFASRFTAGLKSGLDYQTCYTTFENTDPVHENGKVYWDVQAAQHGGLREDIRISEDDVQYMTALYDSRIAEADYYLGALFRKIQALGLEKNTIIILLSEHGEMLGENGWFMRGGSTRGTSYEPALNFPLLIKHPHVAETTVIDDLVQTVDIMPTILTMLGISDPQKDLREGSTLSFSVFGDKPTNDYAYAASMFLPSVANRFFKAPSAAEAIRDREWKLIKSTVFKKTGLTPDSVSYELYNIKEDPYEKKDVSASEPQRAGDLKEKLEVWLHHFTDPGASL